MQYFGWIGEIFSLVVIDKIIWNPLLDIWGKPEIVYFIETILEAALFFRIINWKIHYWHTQFYNVCVKKFHSAPKQQCKKGWSFIKQKRDHSAPDKNVFGIGSAYNIPGLKSSIIQRVLIFVNIITFIVINLYTYLFLNYWEAVINASLFKFK